MATATCFADQGEVTLKQAFAMLYKDSDFHDVTLQGKDGIQVSCNRMALAARSLFFRIMLLGKFSESTNAVVHVGVPGKIVKAIVEYLHTDTCRHLRILSKPSGNTLQPSDVKLLQTILAVEEAASYFQLPGLLAKVHQCLRQKLSSVPAVALVILEAAHGKGRPIQPKTLDLVKVSNKRGMLHAAGLLSKYTMQHILQAGSSNLDDKERLDFIGSWMQNCFGASINHGKQKYRKATAKHLIQVYVELQNIDPQIRTTKLESLGFVNIRHLPDAYKRQALRAKRENGFPFEKPKQHPVWKESGSHIMKTDQKNGVSCMDVIKCPWLTSGIHQWTIVVEVNRTPRFQTWLGMTSSLNFISFSGFWGFGQDGMFLSPACQRVWGNKKAIGRETMVTLTLNLLPTDSENGSIWISLNDLKPVLGIGNLHEHLVDYAGFIPAAYVSGDAQLGLVDFREIREDDWKVTCGLPGNQRG